MSNKKGKKKSTKKEVVETKKVETKEEKISIFNRIRDYFYGVRAEMKRISWTTPKNLIKYSIATVVFVVICSLYIFVVDIVFAAIIGLLG